MATKRIIIVGTPTDTKAIEALKVLAAEYHISIVRDPKQDLIQDAEQSINTLLDHSSKEVSQRNITAKDLLQPEVDYTYLPKTKENNKNIKRKHRFRNNCPLDKKSKRR